MSKWVANIMVCVSVMAYGLFSVPDLALATDGSSGQDRREQHRLLTSELKARIDGLRNRLKTHREHHHHHGGNSNSLEALQAEVSSLKTDLASMEGSQAALLEQMAALVTRVDTLANGGTGGAGNALLAELANHVKVEPGVLNGVKGPHIIFHKANVHVQSGSGSTGDNGTPTGLGNLIIGYNEGPHPDPTSDRNGSHNIVAGTLNAYTATGGIVMGSQNWIQGEFATILGGQNSLAQSLGSSILGGRANFTGSVNQTVPSVP